MMDPHTDIPQSEAHTSDEERVPVPPIESRFMFVDVAALRAKQLRRGARPRVPSPHEVHKLERIAMEEVKRGLVEYATADRKSTVDAPPAA
jgi:DNA-directed RNA polymerase omega subunit